ncbi:TPA: hypothetical protein SMG08_004549 [Serratia marcescens]|uniref:hypothetical protein n=1 Tax=Serratia TaxID=613 RepID=UPI000D3E4F59|nr:MULTISPECIES: hypothetical protein [Serratia]AWC81886.1 hypothetical protein AM377_20365 [Serratia marcescens]HDU7917426.1 hypothetical protein [Serratia marcescens]HEJ7272877.1 hypothetical protein [Serratia marcescens]
MIAAVVVCIVLCAILLWLVSIQAKTIACQQTVISDLKERIESLEGKERRSDDKISQVLQNLSEVEGVAKAAHDSASSLSSKMNKLSSILPSQ